MTNVSQFSDEMDEISSSIFDVTDISTNVSIWENEGGSIENIVQQGSSVPGTSGSSQQPKPRLSREHCSYSIISFFAR